MEKKYFNGEVAKPNLINDIKGYCNLFQTKSKLFVEYLVKHRYPVFIFTDNGDEETKRYLSMKQKKLSDYTSSVNIIDLNGRFINTIFTNVRQSLRKFSIGKEHKFFFLVQKSATTSNEIFIELTNRIENYYTNSIDLECINSDLMKHKKASNKSEKILGLYYGTPTPIGSLNFINSNHHAPLNRAMHYIYGKSPIIGMPLNKKLIENGLISVVSSTKTDKKMLEWVQDIYFLGEYKIKYIGYHNGDEPIDISNFDTIVDFGMKGKYGNDFIDGIIPYKGTQYIFGKTVISSPFGTGPLTINQLIVNIISHYLADNKMDVVAWDSATDLGLTEFAINKISKDLKIGIDEVEIIIPEVKSPSVLLSFDDKEFIPDDLCVCTYTDIDGNCKISNHQIGLGYIIPIEKGTKDKKIKILRFKNKEEKKNYIERV